MCSSDLDVRSISQGFYFTATEALSSADFATAQAAFLETIAENATMLDNLGVSGWVKIIDSQTANWQTISDAQNPGWATINNIQ